MRLHLHLHIICLFSMLFMFPVFNGLGGLNAQELPPWQFVQIPLAAGNDFVRSEIVGFMADGYSPVGLEWQGDRQGDNTLSILGQQRGQQDDGTRNYFLKQFDNFETLPADFAAFLDSGWAPAGASFFSGGMIVLFLSEDTRLTVWKMLEVEGDGFLQQRRSIGRMVADALEEGLEPFALSRLQGRLMIGFVTANRWQDPEGSYLLERYSNDGTSFVTGINARLEEGYTISGYHFHEGEIYIGFFK